eukprot:scaffold47753_cov58-Attheya_sp.AAC.8
MFAVGRFDPRAEGEDFQAKKTKKKKKNSERLQNNNGPKKQRQKPPSGDRKPRKRQRDAPIIEPVHEGGYNSDSSSSVPSSSESESDDEPSKNTPSLKVIAPEQKLTAGTKPNANLPSEAVDDFDFEDEDDLGLNAKGGKEFGRKDTTGSKPSAEISMALHMSTLPIDKAASLWKLAPFLVENLKRDGYEHFFPIQSLVIPDVIASERHAHLRARDVCVSAPTGSGKSLAFVLPVLNSLSKRVVRRLRALVVLPSRDLALQVYKVFNSYSEGSDLRIGLAIGQTDFEAEQKAVVLGPRSSSHLGNEQMAKHRHAFNPHKVIAALDAFPGTTDVSPLSILKGGRSAVDVLVATPGRLMDHLDKTPGFTLQHLRFLVIDEADRLVNQSYQNWIGRVIEATTSTATTEYIGSGSVPNVPSSGPPMPPLELAPDGTSFVIDPITWRREGNNAGDGGFNRNFSNEATSVTRPVQLRKLLYSATLTKDPQKLASLGLVNAKHFDAHHLAINDKSNDGGNDSSYTNHLTSHQRYSVPDSLSEFKVECTAEQKPLVLLALLLELKQRESNNQEGENPTNGIVVVFTSSVDSTHRLARLLQLLWGAAGYGPTAAIAEFSSALNHKQRSRLLKKCNDRSSDSGENISVVVCSDGMSRGMDLPSVSAVINYDVPAYAKTYVHRCGRTARAGRKGIAISVLKGGQVGQFLKMRQLIDNPKRIQPMGVQKHLVSGAIPMYQACVQALRQVMDAENDGEIDNVSTLPSEWIPSANHKKNPVTSHESDSEDDNASHSSSSVPSSDDESM